MAQKNYPNLQFSAYLLMADKKKTATIDGLNQLFRIPKGGDPRKDIIRKVQGLEEIGGTVLTEVKVDHLINRILENEFPVMEGKTFEEAVCIFKIHFSVKKR